MVKGGSRLLLLTVHAFHVGLERIFGDFDARRGNLPTNLIHFKWTFHVDITTTYFKKEKKGISSPRLFPVVKRKTLTELADRQPHLTGVYQEYLRV